MLHRKHLEGYWSALDFIRCCPCEAWHPTSHRWIDGRAWAAGTGTRDRDIPTGYFLALLAWSQDYHYSQGPRPRQPWVAPTVLANPSECWLAGGSCPGSLCVCHRQLHQELYLHCQQSVPVRVWRWVEGEEEVVWGCKVWAEKRAGDSVMGSLYSPSAKGINSSF